VSQSSIKSLEGIIPSTIISLNLSYNNIKIIPSSIFPENYKNESFFNLNIVDLSWNRLINLPMPLLQMSNLFSLNVTGNW